MKKRLQYLLGLFFCLQLLVSCGQQSERGQEVRQWMQTQDKIKVLSTTGMIGDIVKIIGANRVKSLVLITGQLDPHSYQLVKGDGEKFEAADLIFYNGLNLEHGPSLKKILKEKENATALGNLIQEKEPELILQYNGQIDPHIWMDIAIWKKTIPYIVKTLSEYAPEYAKEFEERGKELEKEFDQTHQKIYTALQNIPENKRFLVTSHDAFNYFSKSYLATEEEVKSNSWQKRFVAPEGLAPDSQLSTSDIKFIVDHLEKYQIQVLFPESNLSRDSIRKIVEAGEAKGLDLFIADCPLYADAMGPKGSSGDSYLKMVKHNAKLIGLYLHNYNLKKKVQCE